MAMSSFMMLKSGKNWSTPEAAGTERARLGRFSRFGSCRKVLEEYSATDANVSVPQENMTARGSAKILGWRENCCFVA